jgi:benzoyl-CoA reductase/2-hydroxyglutaryl-CoA dehydratase subunit BcrC/BadD/HgdB
LEDLYQQRSKRAEELRGAGRKVIGYFCCFVPDEIITAFDMVPYRIQGSQSDPIDQADAYIEPMACPFARSCFNLALKGKYDFLDGFVAPHSCDTVERLYHIWRHYKPSPFTHYLNVPHMIGPSSETFYRNELKTFILDLERWSGKKLDSGKLREAVKLYNRRRAALRDLYELRKSNPPLVSGSEITKALVAGMGIPADEHIKLIEDSGAQVVMDDLCTGSRFFWDDVPETADPLDGLVSRYLNIHCPRSYFPQKENREKDLANRFGYIGDFVKDWKANGAIFYIVRYCDTCELDGPDLREYLNGMKVPVLMIEDDYSTSTIGQLRTRVQAFLEMIA